MAFDLNVSKRKKEFDRNVCIFCQEKNDGSFVKNPKASSFIVVREASIRRQDGISSLLENEGNECLYSWHRNCYSAYTSKKNVDRCESRALSNENENNYSLCDVDTPRTSNALITRSVVPKCNFAKCIFCQNVSKKGDKKTFRLSEVEPAKKLLVLCKQRQDHVFLRLSTCADENDIFAADVLYHRICLLEYFYDKEKGVPSTTPKGSSEIDDGFSTLILEIDEELNKKCFEVSYLTERLRQLCNSDDLSINNRLMKRLLVQHYGDSLFFSHPSDHSKPSLVFKTSLKPNELVERIRYMSEKCVNTDTLREDVKKNSFGIKGYLCNHATVDKAFDEFKFSSSWESFFSQVMGKDKLLTSDLKRKCISIYMDLHNLINDCDFTPKHVALAQCIHHYTRSKFIISVLNRLGHCISYRTLTRLDNQVITHIVNNSKNDVPVPTNIVSDSNLFIHGAIDNDDFKEDTYDGKETTHVTAMVLYQPLYKENQERVYVEKIPVPETICKMPELIECQAMRKCPPISKKPEFFPNLSVTQLGLKPTNVSYDDLIWVLSRLDLNSKGNTELIMPKNATCPGWTPFNQVVSTRDMALTNIGFCTLFPAPPTTNDSVYTVMCNFLKLNVQLKQKYAVLSCDMAVYLLAKVIHLQTNGFENLFLRIGTFHLAKNWLSIIGQYLMDSGFVDIIIETGIYGENTIKSVLRGTHYNRGIRVHKLMYEACRRLQFKEFLEHNIDIEEFELTRGLVQKLQLYVTDIEESASTVFERLKQEHSSFFNRFIAIIEEKTESNETFKFWNEYCKMVELLLNCVKADRNGNWSLHLKVVSEMVPYLLLFNHYNYARGCIMYLEDMSNLPPELETAFHFGHFSVKRKSGKFNSVASDHALEQSLIRSSKVQGGLIGITCNESAMRKWCLIYHHKADVSQSILNFCDMSQDPTGDLSNTHKEWSNNRVEEDEQAVQTIVKFFIDHDNPFSESNTPLRNIVSGTLATEQASTFLLNLSGHIQTLYDKFKNDRMIKKCKSLFAPIERNKIFSFNALGEEGKQKAKRFVSIEAKISQTILLATQRNFNMGELMRHELMPYPPSLSHENGHLKKSVKADLLNIIESECKCSETLENLENLQSQAHIYDGMALIHCIPNAIISKIECFKELAQYQLIQIEKALNNKNTNRVDIVYDCYGKSSIKNMEHEIRTGNKPPLIVKIHNDLTKVPKQWSRYLSLPENKKNLIQYISTFVLNKIRVPVGKKLYLSGCFECESLCFSKGDNQEILSQLSLSSNHIEADTRMFLHAKDCLISSSNVQNVIIHSPDTDVFVLGIRFWHELKQFNCRSLWLNIGTGDKRRGLGCHVASESLGEDFSKVLLALHALTGCDTTSKISTKKAAFKYTRLNNDSYDALLSLSVQPITEDTIRKVESLYLDLIKKKGQTCDESRFIHFSTTPSAVSYLDKLPCTSDSFHLHILRCSAQLHFWENALKAVIEPLELTNFGYFKDEDNKLRPLLMTLPATPSSLIQPCNCKSCSKKTCQCSSHRSSCCSYCKCGDRCKNPFNINCGDEEN